MAELANILVKANDLGGIIEVINIRVEDYNNSSLKKNVDVLISEPLGMMLFYERMLESFIIARDTYLKEDGLIFPTYAHLYAAPITDYVLHEWITEKASKIWKSNSFLGFNMVPVLDDSISEAIKTPLIYGYDSSTHIANGEYATVDFRTVKIEFFQLMEFKFSFKSNKTAVLHAFGFWFDALFIGEKKTIKISTSPHTIQTHWKQTRLLLEHPTAINEGDAIELSLVMKANQTQSYNIAMNLYFPQHKITSSNGIYEMSRADFSYPLS